VVLPPYLNRFRRPLLGLYLIVLLTLTLAPLPSAAGGLPDWFDKVVHFGLFTGLSALLAWNLGGRARVPLAVALATLIAALVEIAQGPIPFRSGDELDLFWGAMGALVGAAGAWPILRDSSGR
jgi:VanZ family protein